MNVLSRLAVVTGLFCTGSLWAANIVWNNATGGDLNTGGNWQGGNVPGTSDTARFRMSVSGDCTLVSELTVNAVEFGANGYTGVATLALGSQTLAVNGGLSVVNDSRLTLASGSLTEGGTAYIGNASGGNSRFVVSGAGTTASFTATGGNSPINLGYADSGDCRDNLVEVRDGAQLFGGARLGPKACGHHNTVRVTGAGSTWTATNHKTYIGAVAGSYANMVQLEDGAAFTGALSLGEVAGSVSNTLWVSGANTTWNRTDGQLYIGIAGDYTSVVFSNGYAYVSEYNISLGRSSGETATTVGDRLVVADGATVSVPAVEFGGAGSTVEVKGQGSVLTMSALPDARLLIGNRGDGNVLSFRDGGSLGLAGAAPSLRLGGASSFIVDNSALSWSGDVRIGTIVTGAHDCRLEVSNLGSFEFASSQTPYVGHETFASNNVLAVTTGGSFAYREGLTQALIVGNKNARDNELLIDGGSATIPLVYVGNEIDAAGEAMVVGGNRIVVRNGGVLTCGNIRLGNKLPNSILEINDATVSLDALEASHEGSYASASNAVVRVSGRNAALTATGTVTFTKTATLEVDVTGPQSAEALIKAHQFVFAKGSKIKITSSANLDRSPAFTTTVLAMTREDRTLSLPEIEIDPACGLKLVRDGDGRTLKVRHSGKGLVLLFR